MATYAAGFILTRNGEEVYRCSWFPDDSVESEAGYACDHAASAAQETEDPSDRCGWCDSHGMNGELRQVEVVECPNCEEVCIDDPTGGPDSFIYHLIKECCE